MKKRNFITGLCSFGLVPFIPNIPEKNKYDYFFVDQDNCSRGGPISERAVRCAFKGVDPYRFFEISIMSEKELLEEKFRKGEITTKVSLDELKQLIAEKSLDNSAV